jgi:hypothetical protein
VGADLFHANGQTDMMKLKVASRSFADAPKKGHNLPYRPQLELTAE